MTKPIRTASPTGGSHDIAASLAGQDVSEIHRIPVSREEWVLFDPESLKIYIEKLMDTGDRDVRTSAHTSEDLADLRDRDRTQAVRRQQDPEESFSPRLTTLSRLTLHISNTCNLGCSYCYASGGDYGLGPKLMRSEEAIELLSRSLNVFEIKTLMFFGGEPSLNVDVMADCCLLVTEMHKRGLIAEMPKFAVISNLAGSGRLFERFLAVCKTFNIYVTVSVDGPPVIHDANRPTLAGKGSFERVKRNYLTARELGIPLSIECTYSRKHTDLAISVLDLMKFFYPEFGERQTHIAPASCAPGSSERVALQSVIDSYCEAIQYMIETHERPESLSISMGKQLLNAISDQVPIDQYCPAGNSELTIGPEGQLYPCFMFVGHDDFQMDEIDESSWLTPRGIEVLKNIRRNGKHEHPACKTCWAKNVCFGCIGGDYLESGSLMAKPQCGIVMPMADEAIVRLAEKAQGLPVGDYGNTHRHAYLRLADKDFGDKEERCDEVQN